MRKKLARLLSVVLVLTLFAGCERNPDSENTLVYGSGDYDSINPLKIILCLFSVLFVHEKPIP